MAIAANIKEMSKIPKFIKTSLEELKENLQQIKEAVEEIKNNLQNLKQSGEACSKKNITEPVPCYFNIYG